jgi:hypothetical protein
VGGHRRDPKMIAPCRLGGSDTAGVDNPLYHPTPNPSPFGEPVPTLVAAVTPMTGLVVRDCGPVRTRREIANEVLRDVWRTVGSLRARPPADSFIPAEPNDAHASGDRCRESR